MRFILPEQDYWVMVDEHNTEWRIFMTGLPYDPIKIQVIEYNVVAQMRMKQILERR